ncbi:hypothetical protein B4N84_23835 [Flavobacterium sp. IR1]|nr:hypothetical protein B4N84_23835 [Flavobacterium sp. IR1]
MKRAIKNTICILILMNASNLFSQDYKKHKMFSHNAEIYKISRFTDGIEAGYMPDNTTLDNTVNKRIKEIIQQNKIIGLQLIENNKLKLEDPISKYIDSLPKTLQNITIKQLFMYICEIPDVWSQEGNIIIEKN